MSDPRWRPAPPVQIRASQLTAPCLTVVLTLLAGCGHKVEGPKVTVTGIEPNLVCNAQRISASTDLIVHGTGFAPLPTSVLDLPETLVLPTVTLTQSQTLTGTEADLAVRGEVVFEGSPSDAGLSGNLTWQQPAQMTLTVSEQPPVNLPPGLYDLTVDNPDGVQSATLAQALAVVAPPSIASVDPLPPVLCTAQSDRTLVIDGANFLRIGSMLSTVTLAIADGASADFVPDSMDGCAAIPGTFGGGEAQLCTQMTVTLPEAQLDPGAYGVVVTSPAPADCISSEAVTVVIVPPPFVSAVVPPAICIDQGDQEVRIEGGSFLDVAGALPEVGIEAAAESLMLEPTLSDCTAVEGVDAVDSCVTITVTVEQGALPEGDYTLHVTNPQPAGCSSAQDVVITVSPPPQVDTVAPSTVCEGGSRLMAFGDNFAEDATVELSCTDKVVESITVNRISATEIEGLVGPGIAPGETCDVIVRNGDGCEDRPLPHQQVVGTPGPLLFFADPFVVYNGINTGVTLFATTIAAPLPAMPVTLVPSGEMEPRTQLAATIVAGHPNRAQITVPQDQAPGLYDAILEDDSGCFAILEGAITVTDQADLTIESVRPPFGHTADTTAVTITGGGNVAFADTPRGFLNPAGPGAVAVPLEFVAMSSGDTLTAVVPAGIPAGVYELVIVNPTGEVGVLAAAFTVLDEAPPLIRDVTPQSMTNEPGNSLVIKGANFRNAEVSLSCQNAAGGMETPAGVVTGATVCATPDSCTVDATVDASGLSAPGTLCVVRVTNDPGVEDSWAEFSGVGVTGPSLNLPDPQLGEPMGLGRRALVASAVKATTAARFVYAIGGDGGAGVSDAPFDSVEVAPVTVFGEMRPWRDANEALIEPRAFAGGATIGRYVYVFGGSDGTDALATAERAMVLAPEESPAVQDVDLVLDDVGLAQGQWSYRVSAVFSGADLDNPGGESLPSDQFTIRLPDVGAKNIQVKLSWSAPNDLLGVPLPNVESYRIYRTADQDPGGPGVVLIGSVPSGGPLEFLDDGSAVPDPAQAPLPLGSTGTWHSLPNLNTARNGPAAAVAPDPGDVDPADGVRWVLYALQGQTGGTEAGGTGLSDYEHFSINVLPNGRQELVSGGWTTGATASSVGKWQHGAWTVDSVVSSFVAPGDVYLYVGGGLTGGGNGVGTVEAVLVLAGGELDVFLDDLPGGQPDEITDMAPSRAGFGLAAANGQLFAFGGYASGAKRDAVAANMQTPAPRLASNSWNNEGLSMNANRYLLGSAVQSALIFLIGGEDGAGNALSSTETVIW